MSSEQARAGDPTHGWTHDGRMSPHVSPWSPASQAMRTLIALRRDMGATRLAPRGIATHVLRREAVLLQPMFSMRTLERWAKCDEWRAWELLEWTCALDGHPGVAALMVVRCGYLTGDWWGGRYVPRPWIYRWLRNGHERPKSAALDLDLLDRFGPPCDVPELLDIATRMLARPDGDVGRCAADELELDL